ncbi:MAG: choice-of-anchor D domain-containing protein, partial [Deltaproteobacteria bacterium]|nr:choice-of-anchor D domain-containing protein [Deltaproteobacteria bacterium]
ALTADVTTIDLGTVRLGEASAAHSVRVTNTTNAPISIGNATVADAQFVLDPAPSPAPIAPGATATFAVRYVPSVAGAASSQIEIVLVGETATEVTIGVAGLGLGEDEGGCCSTGDGAGSSSVLLGFAVLGALRRRRRRS